MAELWAPQVEASQCKVCIVGLSAMDLQFRTVGTHASRHPALDRA